MLSGIKGYGVKEVEESEIGDMSATNGTDKMIVKRKKYSFSRMKLAVSRLEGI